MIAELDSVQRLGEGYVIKGTVNGHSISIDLPTTYVERMEREAGRDYMRRSLIKVWCATMGIDPPESVYRR